MFGKPSKGGKVAVYGLTDLGDDRRIFCKQCPYLCGADGAAELAAGCEDFFIKGIHVRRFWGDIDGFSAWEGDGFGGINRIKEGL